VPREPRVQQLHLVGFTTDRKGLIFATRRGAKSGTYVVSVDERLVSSVGELARLAGLLDGASGPGAGAPEASLPADGAARLEAEDHSPAAPGRSAGRPRSPALPVPHGVPRSALSPREMQARLRQGSSVADVAAAAGVDEEWVERFAAPVLAEQARVVARAQEAVFAKRRVGVSVVPLGQAVRTVLAERGVFLPDDVFDAGWSAFHAFGSRWVVSFQYRSRGRTRVAEWDFDLGAGELRARNRVASELSYVGPSRRQRPVLANGAVPRARAARPTRPAKAGSPARTGQPTRPTRPRDAPVATGRTASASSRGGSRKRAASRRKPPLRERPVENAPAHKRARLAAAAPGPAELAPRSAPASRSGGPGAPSSAGAPRGAGGGRGGGPKAVSAAAGVLEPGAPNGSGARLPGRDVRPGPQRPRPLVAATRTRLPGPQRLLGPGRAPVPDAMRRERPLIAPTRRGARGASSPAGEPERRELGADSKGSAAPGVAPEETAATVVASASEPHGAEQATGPPVAGRGSPPDRGAARARPTRHRSVLFDWAGEAPLDGEVRRHADDPVWDAGSRSGAVSGAVAPSDRVRRLSLPRPLQIRAGRAGAAMPPSPEPGSAPA
jgi:hypothetical protein